jgi:choline dehydrogenase-like flavoprotein
MSRPELPAHADTIVVGAGTGGAAFAGMFARHSTESVPLLEAGPDYGRPRVRAAAGRPPRRRRDPAVPRLGARRQRPAAARAAGAGHVSLALDPDAQAWHVQAARVGAELMPLLNKEWSNSHG